jgi:hypothetical protein
MRGRSTPWYVEEKLRDGAFATFLGLTCDPACDELRPWHAIAVGDCCLFHIHNGDLQLSFPLKQVAEFGSRPALIASRPRFSTTSAALGGNLAPGDTLLMATDSLAAWLLAEYEAGRKPWNDLIGLTDERFVAWAQRQRSLHCLKNDDLTLLVIEN